MRLTWVLPGWAALAADFAPIYNVTTYGAAGNGKDDPVNPAVDFHGEKRSGQTHASTTDADAMLYRRVKGQGDFKLIYRGGERDATGAAPGAIPPFAQPGEPFRRRVVHATSGNPNLIPSYYPR